MPGATQRLGATGARPSRPADPVELADVDVDVECVPVLRGVQLRVAAGEVLGLTGPNGSGKSTLLAVLATLLRPVGGTGQVLGATLGTRECAAVRPRIALVGHTAALYPELTLAENLRLLARLIGATPGLATDALGAVGLAGAAGRSVARCSSGMLRRADLARVLLTRPALLLLDEPHTGLDASAAGLVELVVGEVRDGGGACVLVSHDPARLAGLADRTVELVDGRPEPGGAG